MIRRGFTLTELVVVIVILVLAIGLLLPATRKVREPAARARCTNNLKQVMIGLHSYADVNGHFPAGCFGASGHELEQRLSWQVALLPYIEEAPLYSTIDPNKGYSPELATTLKAIAILRCPEPNIGADPVTTYVGMAGLGENAARRREADPANGIMGYDRRCALKDITDGTANTIALAETNHTPGRWAQGGPGTVRAFDAASGYGPDRPLGSAHAGGFNVAMCDCSVRFVKFTQNPSVFAAAVTVAGGEQIELD